MARHGKTQKGQRAAPRPPPKPVQFVPSRTPIEKVVDAFVGRGVRPVSNWLVYVLGPMCMMAMFASGNVLLLLLAICAWTAPMEVVASFLVDLGKIRESLADCVPLLPGIAPYAPEMLRVLIPNAFKLAPGAGTLAPYLKYLLRYPEFAAKSLPHLVPKFDVMLKFNMIEQIGPAFAEMDMRHYSKLEKILPDMMAQLDKLAPYFHIIAPHVVEISLRADKLFPYIDYMLPHAETMKDHIWWLIPFADIEGVEEFMPYLDDLAPFIDDFAPYGLELLPYVSKIRKHIPILIENAETLVPQL
jgi:hypothetical protein